MREEMQIKKNKQKAANTAQTNIQHFKALFSNVMISTSLTGLTTYLLHFETIQIRAQQNKIYRTKWEQTGDTFYHFYEKYNKNSELCVRHLIIANST